MLGVAADLAAHHDQLGLTGSSRNIPITSMKSGPG